MIERFIIGIMIGLLNNYNNIVVFPILIIQSALVFYIIFRRPFYFVLIGIYSIIN